MAMYNFQVVILAGGQGSRMQEITGGRPKCLVDYFGRPFIYTQLDWLAGWGIKNVIIAAGCRAEDVVQELGSSYKDIQITYSVEQQPLGTAGGLRNMLNLTLPMPILVLNCDSLVYIQLYDFLTMSWGLERGTMVAVRVPDASDYGTIEIVDGKTVFTEKKGLEQPGWVSAGMYLLTYEMIASLSPNIPLSLEYDIFPDIDIPVFFTDSRFIDIGTPNRYFDAIGAIRV